MVDLVVRLERIGRQIRRRRMATRACWAFVAAAAGAAALIAADSLLGVHRLGARIALTSLLVVGAVAAARRWLIAMPRRITALEVAHSIQERYPHLRSLVASAVEFSAQDPKDPTGGSADLRRSVVVRAASELDHLDLDVLVPRQAVRRASAAAGAVALAIALAGVLAPASLATGVSRLVNPWGEAEWPRRHHLQFEAPPQQIPLGGDFRAELRDQAGQLPPVIEMQYRIRSGERVIYQTERVTTSGQVVTIRRTNVQHSFEYRAQGGDDRHMAWQTIEVVPPPKILDLQLEAEPPAYLGRLAGALIPPYRIVAGSLLRITGVIDAPVQQVELETPAGRRIAADIGKTGKDFSIEAGNWTPDESGKFSFRFTTVSRLTMRAARTFRMEIVADRPPTVSWVEPTEELTLLPTAQLPVVVAAQDDWGLQRVTLHVVTRLQATEHDLLRLDSAPSPNGVQPATGRTLHREMLALSDYSVAAGDTVALSGEVADLAEQTAETAHRIQLRIASRSEMLRLLDARRRGLLDALERALRHLRASQSALKDETRSAQQSLFFHRRASQSISGGPDAALESTKRLLREYERNGLNDVDAANQLTRWRDRLNLLATDQLPEIAGDLQLLARGGKLQPGQTDAGIREAVEQRQQSVISLLEAALAELAQWDQLKRFERELVEAKNTQERLQQQTSQLARDVLARETDRNDQQLLNRQSRLLADQRRAASQFADLANRMAKTARQLAATEPATAARLERAVAQAEQLRIQVQLSDAVDELAARRFARAAERQKQAAASLESLLEQLAAAGEQELAKQVDDLRAAERQLQKLQRELDQNQGAFERARKSEAAERELQRLQRDRFDLGGKTEELGRRLHQLDESAAHKTRRAGERLQGQSQSDETAQQARQDLQDAEAALADKRARQQTLLAREQIRRLETQLRAMVDSQQALAEEVIRLGRLQDNANVLTEAQAASVRQAARRQAMIREQVEQLAETLSELPVFVYLLHSAANAMTRVEGSLATLETGSDVQQQALSAVEQLRMIVEAISEQKRLEQSEQGDSPSGGEGGGQDGQQQLQALQLALGQLRLLRSLQLRLQEDTRSFEAATSAGDLAATEVESRAMELVGRQQRLLELTDKLQREVPLPPAEDLMPNLELELQESLE